MLQFYDRTCAIVCPVESGEYMKKRAVSILYIIVGNLLIAFAISTLVLDHGLVAGGVTGISLVVNEWIGLPVGSVVAGVNVLLFLVGLICLGKVFALTTLLSSFLFPIFLNLFEGMSALHGFCQDVLLASVLAGCLIGIGIGLVLKAEASTGGTDILALLVHKQLHIPIAVTLNVIDFAFIVLQMSQSDTMKVLYGLVVIFITSFMLNKTLVFGKNLIQVLVFSDEYEQMRGQILKEVDAGVSLLSIEKGLSKCNSKAILSVIPHRKLQELKRVIKGIDENAFITISDIHEVNGKGYTLDRQINAPDVSMLQAWGKE